MAILYAILGSLFLGLMLYLLLINLQNLSLIDLLAILGFFLNDLFWFKIVD
jgi:hypothetical protein